ncbi:MAG: protein-L-isoaspartate O-methyltransferase family protein [Wenzhouxiangellaceae bacterium]
MIKQQLRTWEVLDSRVLEVLETTPRELFVPARHRRLAFSDLRIPLGHEQTMMKPNEEGRALQSLALSGTEHVLEVGTGSGFLTACLARLAGKVTSIEIIEELAELAGDNLEQVDSAGIELLTGDVFEQSFAQQSFDAILVSSSVPTVPENLSAWLKPGGRMFIVRGHSPAMEALLIRRSESGRLAEESLFDTDLPRLVGAEDQPVFEF